MPPFDRSHLKHAETTHHILGAFYEIYNSVGSGLAETAYQRAMVRELRDRGRKVVAQRQIQVRYGRTTLARFRPDLLVDGRVLVEIKARSRLLKSHWAQLLSYLRMSRIEVGLLINFGPRPQFKRLVLSLDPLKGTTASDGRRNYCRR